MRTLLSLCVVSLVACNGPTPGVSYHGVLLDELAQPVSGGVVVGVDFGNLRFGQTTTAADGSFVLAVPPERFAFGIELRRSADPASAFIFLNNPGEQHDLGHLALLGAPATVTAGPDGITVVGDEPDVDFDEHLWLVNDGPIPYELAAASGPHLIRAHHNDGVAGYYSDGVVVAVPDQPSPQALYGEGLESWGDGAYASANSIATVILATPTPLHSFVILGNYLEVKGIELESFSKRWPIPGTDCHASSTALVCRGDWPLVERFHLVKPSEVTVLVVR